MCKKLPDYQQHPERRRGEIFQGNVKRTHFNQLISNGWKTVRLGKVAYGSDGKPRTDSGYKPLFVRRSEVKKRGFDPDTVWIIK